MNEKEIIDKFKLPSIPIVPPSFFNIVPEKKDAIFVPPADNIFDCQPAEIKVAILRFLTVNDLCAAARVSKHWNYLTSLNCLWQRFFDHVSSDFDMLTLKQQYRSNFSIYSQCKKSFYTNRFSSADLSPGLNPLGMNPITVRMKDEYIPGGNEDDPTKRFVVRR